MKRIVLALLAILATLGASGCAAEEVSSEDTAELDINFELDATNYEHRDVLLSMLMKKHPVTLFRDPREGKATLSAWQAKSGRSKLEWWSVLNFRIMLGELVWLKERGDFRRLRLKLPDARGYRITDEERAAHEVVYDLYERIETLTRSGREDEARKLERPLRDAFWNAHDVALHAAERDVPGALEAMPEEERAFADLFAHDVEPVLSALGAPPADLSVVDRAFPGEVLGTSAPSDATRRLLLSFEAVRFIEHTFDHPLRGAANFARNHLDLGTVDAMSMRWSRFIEEGHARSDFRAFLQLFDF